MKLITEEELIEKARIWLKKESVVIATQTFTSEKIPVRGALGWTSRNETIYIECVTDRAAFKRKAGKIDSTFPYGDYRLILTMPEVIKSNQELPAGWGLLIYDGLRRTVSYEREAKLQSKNANSELTVIISLLRRVGVPAAEKGAYWIDSYKFLNDNRAFLSVAVLPNELEIEEHEIEV